MRNNSLLYPLTFFLMLWAAPALFADSDAGFTYTISGTTATITSYSGSGGSVIIPSTIGTGYTVTSIGNYAFSGCSGLTGVTIPDSVSNIGYCAFSSCSNMTALTVGVLNANYCSEKGVLFDKKAQVLIQYPTAKTGTYKIPGTVTHIEDYAFANCGLTGITLPNSITSIGNGAFFNSPILAMLLFCGEYAPTAFEFSFSECPKLSIYYYASAMNWTNPWYSKTTIAINPGERRLTGIEIIGPAFMRSSTTDTYACVARYSDNSTATVTPVWSITNGGMYATITPSDGILTAQSVTNIQVVTLQASYTESASTKTVTSTVKINPLQPFSYAVSSGKAVINGYFGDSTVTVPSTLDGYTVSAIGVNAFYSNSLITSVRIPDSVTNIGARAFEYCSNLTSVSIGSGLSIIGAAAFSSCSKLNTLFINGDAPKSSLTLFNLCVNLTLYYPSNALAWTNPWKYVPTVAIDTLSPPVAPTNTTASYGKYINKVHVSWTASPGATDYLVYRGTNDQASEATLLGTRGGIEYEDKTVQIGATYTYWIKAENACGLSGFSNVGIGAAYLNRDPWDPADDTVTNGTVIAPSDTIQAHSPHMLGTLDYNDYYAIEMASNTTYYFETAGNSDTYGNIYSSADFCTPAAYNDNAGTNKNFSIAFTPTATGTYYIRVSEHTMGDTGEYSLNYSRANNSNGFLYLKSESVATIIGYTGGGGAVVIPSSLSGYPVTAIRAGAFRSCPNLTSVIIPDSIISVGDYAFSSCSNLSAVTIGRGVSSIGVRSFENCVRLVSLTMGDSVYDIGDYAFYNCDSLVRIDLPSSLFRVAHYAFADCGGLGTLLFKGNAPSVSADLFTGCSNLIIYYYIGATGWTTSWCGFPTVYVDPLNPAPVKPTTVAASDGSFTDRVRITWTVSPGARTYQVYRGTTNDAVTAMLVATMGATSYDDTTAVVNVTCYYWVKAVSPLGTSDFSVSDSGYRRFATYWSDVGAAQPALMPSGTTYLINTPEAFARFAYEVNAGNTFSGYTVQLASDIDLSKTGTHPLPWAAIGLFTARSFQGVFDGKGYVIRHLYINSTAAGQGLFGYVDQGTLQNVTLDDTCTVTASAVVGGVVGCLTGGLISNCLSAATIQASGANCAGVVGQCLSSTVLKCSNLGSVTAGNLSGGVVGVCTSSTIKNCYNTGSYSGGFASGGVVGSCTASSVQRCYNTGPVTAGGANVGGVVGGCSSSSMIEACYNTGRVSSNGYSVGGVVGGASRSTVRMCFNSGSVSGASSTGGVAGSNLAWCSNAYGVTPAITFAISTIEKCYSTGSVNGGGTFTGGVVGHNNAKTLNIGTAMAMVKECYSVGTVSGWDGFLINSAVGWSYAEGSSSTDLVSGVYYDADKSGKGDSFSTPLTTIKMTGITAAECMSALDFSEGADWVAVTNTGNTLYYPQLAIFAAAEGVLTRTVSLASVSIPFGSAPLFPTEIESWLTGLNRTDSNVVALAYSDVETAYLVNKEPGFDTNESTSLSLKDFALEAPGVVAGLSLSLCGENKEGEINGCLVFQGKSELSATNWSDVAFLPLSAGKLTFHDGSAVVTFPKPDVYRFFRAVLRVIYPTSGQGTIRQLAR